MIRRPPRSPLFPYPTLSRSLRGDLGLREAAEIRQLDHATLNIRQLGERAGDEPLGLLALDAPVRGVARRGERSEEHTSELQSLAYLVCRLLLEKKKNTTIAT